MSSYFDNASSQVRTNFANILEVEAQVIADIIAVINDPEFPSDLKVMIQKIIETKNYNVPHAKEMDEALQQSQLVEALHDAFHELAQRRIKTRFGTFSDRPTTILAMIDSFDKGDAKGDF
jgi:hypothetical protein